MAITNRGASFKLDEATISGLTSATVEFVEDEKIDVTTLANSTGYRDYIEGMNGVETINVSGEWAAADFTTLESYLNGSSVTATLTLQDGTVISGSCRVTKITINAEGYEGSVKASMTGVGDTAAWTIV